MTSTFEVFRILLSILIMVFILLVFLRIADMYMTLQTMKNKIQTVNAFEETVRQVYTTGYPATFQGFTGFETIEYDYDGMGNSGRIKSDAGVKTLDLPVFFRPDRESSLALEKKCEDFGWWRFCWVNTVPKSMRIFFNPVTNTREARALILNISENFGQTELFVCNSTAVAPDLPYSRDDFSYIMANLGYLPSSEIDVCDAYITEPSVLVIIGSVDSAPQPARQNIIIVDPASKKIRDIGGIYEYHDESDIAAFIIGGNSSLDFKKRVFNQSLEAAASVMKARSVLLNGKMKILNRPLCPECPPQLYPKECGGVSYNGIERSDGLFLTFANSLDSLVQNLNSDEYWDELNAVNGVYTQLKSSGCE